MICAANTFGESLIHLPRYFGVVGTLSALVLIFGVALVLRVYGEVVRYSSVLDGTFGSRFEPVNVDPYLQFKENLKEATGFEYLTYYTLMNHYGSHVPSESQNLNGQVHTINSWTPHHGCDDAGSMIFYYMNVSQYTESSAAQLTNDLGLTAGLPSARTAWLLWFGWLGIPALLSGMLLSRRKIA